MNTSFKSISVLLILSCSCFAESVVKRTGERITLTACGTEGDTINFYRKTGLVTTPVKLSTVVRVPDIFECKAIQYIMPAGTTREYRFFAVPVQSGEVLEETNGVRVKRVR